MKVLCCVAAIVAAWLLAGSALGAPPATLATDRPCPALVGLPGVYVHVTTLAPAGLGEELSPAAIKLEIEARLRDAGVPVLTRQELPQVPGAPILDLQICLLKHNTIALYQYSVEALLWERVALARNPDLVTQAITWRSGVKFGTVMAELLPARIYDVLDVHLGRLIHDLYRANPDGPVRPVAPREGVPGADLPPPRAVEPLPEARPKAGIKPPAPAESSEPPVDLPAGNGAAETFDGFDDALTLPAEPPLLEEGALKFNDVPEDSHLPEDVEDE